MSDQLRERKRSTTESNTLLDPPLPSDERDWWTEFSKESAIHSLPYVARKDLHWIERIFWLATIIAAAYYAVRSCMSQWERFRDNPIVYEYEYLFALRTFPFLGITFCNEFPELEPTDELILKTWAVDPKVDVEKGQYYRKFLLALNFLHYDNLQILERYENDTTLQNLPFVSLLLNLQKLVLPDPNQTNPEFAATLTEVGICQTTTQLSRYGNPFGKIETLKVPEMRDCSSFANCQTTIKPALNYTRLFLYLHDVNEVMMPNDRRTIVVDTANKISYMLKLVINPISAEDEVRKLPISYRKCRYTDENNLQYYSPYHPSLCYLDCRIRVAMDLCNCKPYFYAAAPELPICEIADMMCLHRKHWLKVPCNCLPLCLETSYTVVEELGQSAGGMDYVGATFERTILIQMDLPKMGMKRRVVFSTDQLIMSFGGAIGLFLGASCMTIYGLVHLTMYFLVVKCKNRLLLKRYKNANKEST